MPVTDVPAAATPITSTEDGNELAATDSRQHAHHGVCSFRAVTRPDLRVRQPVPSRTTAAVPSAAYHSYPY